MKTIWKAPRVVAAITIVALHVGAAQAADAADAAAAEVETVLRGFFSAMSARDADGLRAVLDKQLAAVEAGETSAIVHFLNTSDDKAMLPPEGNEEWSKDKVSLSAVHVEVSSSHPTVAMASFTLTFHVTDERAAEIEAMLKEPPAELSAAQRKVLEKVVADRAEHNAMFAMFARQHGKWKIVSLTLPK